MPDNERTQRTEKGLEIAVPKRKVFDDALDQIAKPLPSEDDRQPVRDRAGDEPPPKGTGRPRK